MEPKDIKRLRHQLDERKRLNQSSEDEKKSFMTRAGILTKKGAITPHLLAKQEKHD